MRALLFYGNLISDFSDMLQAISKKCCVSDFDNTRDIENDIYIILYDDLKNRTSKVDADYLFKKFEAYSIDRAQK